MRMSVGASGSSVRRSGGDLDSVDQKVALCTDARVVAGVGDVDLVGLSGIELEAGEGHVGGAGRLIGVVLVASSDLDPVGERRKLASVVLETADNADRLDAAGREEDAGRRTVREGERAIVRVRVCVR